MDQLQASTKATIRKKLTFVCEVKEGDVYGVCVYVFVCRCVCVAC